MLPLPAILISIATVSACAAPAAPSDPAASSDLGDGHGYVAGAEEVAEPPLHLLTLSGGGSVDQMDLLDGSWSDIGELGAVTDAVTDGRFVFASDGARVTIVDSGVWTRDHEDHFHYYRASPRVIGSIEGAGAATISPGSIATGVFFPLSGVGVMLDNAALGDGVIVEIARVDGEPHAGSIVQLGTSTLVTTAGDMDSASAVEVRNAAGEPGNGVGAACEDAGPPVTTSVGVAFPCADGALLATNQDDGIRFERIPYPDAAAPPAASFAAREGRPSVAGLAGSSGVWLLDTRERTVTLLPTEVPLIRVTAVDDEGGHILGLTGDGRVTVISAENGTTLATTEPLVPETLKDPQLLPGVTLVADQQRAYLNAPAEKKLYEIDFADSARVARTFETADLPLFLAGTGR